MVFFRKVKKDTYKITTYLSDGTTFVIENLSKDFAENMMLTWAKYGFNNQTSQPKENPTIILNNKHIIKAILSKE